MANCLANHLPNRADRADRDRLQCRSRIALNVIYPKSASAMLQPQGLVQRWVCLLLCLGLLCVAVAPPAFALPQGGVAARVNLDVAPGCLDLVEGGGFEQVSLAWQTVASARPPMYTNERTFDGSAQAMRIGNGLELPNIASASEVRHRPIFLPTGATRIILYFRYYALHEGIPDIDSQKFSLYDATNDQLIYTFLDIRENAIDWKLATFDLTAYAGRSVSLRFRVDNDGGSGRTLMYIDNVELEYCAPVVLPTFTATSPLMPSATPSATLTPSATPIFTPVTVVPTVPVPPEDLNCPNILVNGNFEGFDGWHFGEDPVPPQYVNNFFQEGTRAVLLGNPPEHPLNVITFSSIRQLVTLPFTTGQIQLRWWRLLQTAQAGVPTATTDRQDLILLSPGLQPIQILRRELRNDGIWQEDVVDLTKYRGQTLYLYFNAFNDANNARTWMYLDNVRLRVCGIQASASNVSAAFASTPIAIPLTPSVTFTMAPMPTPSPSPLSLLTVTETVAVAFAPLPILTETPTLLAAPTINMNLLPTLATQPVVASPTALTIASPTAPPDTIVAITPTPIISQEPVEPSRLGVIAVLISISVLIALIVFGITRIFRTRT